MPIEAPRRQSVDARVLLWEHLPGSPEGDLECVLSRFRHRHSGYSWAYSLRIARARAVYSADPWQADTYATKFGAHEKNAGAGAQGFCDSLLGFGLPASSGKAFVDKIWSAAIPTSYWDGTLYMLGMLHVSGTFKLWY